MTLHGLQGVGLSDWPNWFRKQNPGYFDSDVRGDGISGRVGRTRRVAGNGVGLPAACCGSLHAVNGICGGRVEGLRGNIQAAVRERGSGRILEAGELGEQIIARLRGMSKGGKVDDEMVAAGHGGANAMIERKAARDTKNWEDESENEADDNETDRVKGDGKLVDF